jgi:polar amino acid transport system substrate-binding protein
MTTINQTAIASTNAIERYNEANPDNPINLEYTEEEIILQLQELQAGKCDFVVIEKPVYEFYKQEYNLDLEERELSDDVLSDIFADPYAFFLINSAHPDLVEAIDGALEEVMSDGTVTAISEKYFGVDFAPDYSSLNLEDYK